MKLLTDASMLQLIVQGSYSGDFHGIIPSIACFPKLAKDYVKTLCELWTKTLGESADASIEEQVRICAFVGLRKLAVVAPAYMDLILKVCNSQHSSIRLALTFLLHQEQIV